jgi:hypothetical protein
MNGVRMSGAYARAKALMSVARQERKPGHKAGRITDVRANGARAAEDVEVEGGDDVGHGCGEMRSKHALLGSRGGSSSPRRASSASARQPDVIQLNTRSTDQDKHTSKVIQRNTRELSE